MMRVIWSESDDFVLKKPIADVCFSPFLGRYRANKAKKYLHMWLSTEGFTDEEVKKFLNYLKIGFKFKYSKQPFKWNDKLLTKDDHFVVSIFVNENSLGEIKLLYHLLRVFYECSKYRKAMKKALEMHKIVKAPFINLLIFCIIEEPDNFESYHSFVDSLSNSKEVFTGGLQKFKNRAIVSKNAFNCLYFKRYSKENKTVEELVKLYKNK